MHNGAAVSMASHRGHRLQNTLCSVAAHSPPAWQAPRSMAVHGRCSRPSRLRTAAAAPEAWTAEDGSTQQPSVDFLGVVNDMQTAKGFIHTAADPSLVYDILSDYDSCPRVFRSVASSQTVFTEAGGKQIIQVKPAVAAVKSN